MAFTVTRNRISELRDALKLLQDSRHRQESLKPKAETAVNVFHVEMMIRAPIGRVEPNYSIRRREGGGLLTISHGRPSLRQHGVTLRQGWVQPDIQPTNKGVSFAIRSIAPQIAILLAGAKVHGIGFSSFWWISQRSRAIYDRINHPGFPRNPFVDEAVKAKRPFMLAKFREGMAVVMAPLRMFFK